ncbi:helix-turn-helix domain-containing protein [Paenibacillus koleovorans]|uniref:helix-turn-helix domain-containing protein n=1 Tax=Paenibacillus koleovorans TaxID=121608 RepID=UPI000FDBBD09|nr:AraC family transcriptional regulator [Paenibacillus koleovorans]
MGTTYKIESISQLHELMGYEKPKHPLITIFDYSKIKPIVSTIDLHIITSFYSIGLKNGDSCRTKFGRQYYDFHEGSLVFLSPGQSVFISEEHPEETESNGWNLCFHPDLIYRSALGKKMNEYTFFTYNSNEALHLSDQEKQKVTEVVYDINHEISQNTDEFSQDLIHSYLELLLSYCKRFYGRQFITRTKVNKEEILRFEEILKNYFDSDKLKTSGLPSVKFLAQEIGYSPNYLSDLLKKETGKNTQEHIHFYLIERAKSMLLGTQKPVNVIAHELGFEYPQHFSKLFKLKTGRSPIEYRN